SRVRSPRAPRLEEFNGDHPRHHRLSSIAPGPGRPSASQQAGGSLSRSTARRIWATASPPWKRAAPRGAAGAVSLPPGAAPFTPPAPVAHHRGREGLVRQPPWRPSILPRRHHESETILDTAAAYRVLPRVGGLTRFAGGRPD